MNGPHPRHQLVSSCWTVQHGDRMTIWWGLTMPGLTMIWGRISRSWRILYLMITRHMISCIACHRWPSRNCFHLLMIVSIFRVQRPWLSWTSVTNNWVFMGWLQQKQIHWCNSCVWRIVTGRSCTIYKQILFFTDFVNLLKLVWDCLVDVFILITGEFPGNRKSDLLELFDECIK